MFKYTPQLLKKLEEVFDENGYKVRYEKGNFKSGFCVIEDRKLIMVNKFAPVESRINTLLEITKLFLGNQLLQGDRADEIARMLQVESKEEEAAR